MAEGSTSSSRHTPLPPTTEDGQLTWLRLLRSRRVGVATFHRLLSEHGSAETALDALPKVAADAGAKDYTPCPIGVARAEMAAGRKAGAKMVCFGSPAYPKLLAEIPDPPPILWTKGNLGLPAKGRCIALVGARNASSLGTRTASAFAQELGAHGFVVTSGLARGIDTSAHLASLATGTIAVLGGGVDNIYPTENTDLYHRVAEEGLLISEQPMGLAPQARHFPMRNRIISGLCDALVVIEAAAKSGSLITARTALDQCRDVLAVPGHPFDARSGGSNLLIRDGATLVRNVADIIEAIGAPEPVQQSLDLSPPKPQPKRSIAALHKQILSRLSPSPIPEDALLRDLGADARDFAPVVTDMELNGEVRRHPGGLLSRETN